MDESEDNVRERLIFAPALAIPRMDADSDMEGADDTAGRSPIWPPPQALERGVSLDPLCALRQLYVCIFSM